jgi:hypothetical protein
MQTIPQQLKKNTVRADAFLKRNTKRAVIYGLFPKTAPELIPAHRVEPSPSQFAFCT